MEDEEDAAQRKEDGEEEGWFRRKRLKVDGFLQLGFFDTFDDR